MYSGRIAKNCEGSVIATYLQAYKFAHHSDMDIGRRHRVPGSETKNVITYSNSSSQRINIFCCMLLSPSPTGGYEGSQVTFAHLVDMLWERNLELREPESSIMGRKKT